MEPSRRSSKHTRRVTLTLLGVDFALFAESAAATRIPRARRPLPRAAAVMMAPRPVKSSRDRLSFMWTGTHPDAARFQGTFASRTLQNPARGSDDGPISTGCVYLLTRKQSSGREGTLSTRVPRAAPVCPSGDACRAATHLSSSTDGRTPPCTGTTEMSFSIRLVIPTFTLRRPSSVNAASYGYFGLDGSAGAWPLLARTSRSKLSSFRGVLGAPAMPGPRPAVKGSPPALPPR
jgi:hypothetical protein